MAQLVNVTGFNETLTWRPSIPYVKVGGIWKVPKSIWRKISGVWYSGFLQGGVEDTTFNFNTGTEANSEVSDIAIQTDGKIILAGGFTTFNGTVANRITRLNTDGTRDTTFNTGTGSNNGVNAIAIQTDGKIILAGNFTAFNGTPANKIARLNTNGTIDTTFNAGTGSNNFIISIAIQTDGKIVVAGLFTTFNGTPANNIVRLNTNGTIDTTFTTGTGANITVRDIAIQTDGKIIIGGEFTAFNGAVANKIARLNTNGTIDTTFNTGTGFNSGEFGVSADEIAIQTDGKIVVAGSFTTFNGAVANTIVRLNTNGTIDTTFATNTVLGSGDFSSYVGAIAIQTDGNIILGGSFTDFNGTPANGIARLNTNGTIDTNLGLGVNQEFFGIFAIAIQTDGKIILGGSFTGFSGTPANRIIRVGGDIRT
jgi:uncharacterized delta-60 repeat protein